MTLESFLDGVPNSDIERIVDGLEHTSIDGRIVVCFFGMPEYILQELARHEVVTPVKSGYKRGEYFEELQNYNDKE